MHHFLCLTCLIFKLYSGKQYIESPHYFYSSVCNTIVYSVTRPRVDIGSLFKNSVFRGKENIHLRRWGTDRNWDLVAQGFAVNIVTTDLSPCSNLV